MTGTTLVMTTTNDGDTEAAIIDALLTSKLAACIQVLPITSHYVWQGKTENSEEKMLFIKTRKALFSKIKETIMTLHNYEEPEIIMLDITAGSTGYLDWVNAVTTDDA